MSRIMENVTLAIEGIKDFAKKSSENFINGAFRKCPISSNHDPIEILKRLQREAFSDIMKIRERQEKTERILSLYKTSKGGPFQEASTHMKGIIDLVGGLIFVENKDQMACNALDRAGMRTGIDLRFIFKTAVRRKDLLLAQFVASQSSLFNHDNLCGSPLALEKVMYLANIKDWLSVIMTPLGAQCNDFGVASNFQQQGRRLLKVSSFVPPLFSQHYNCGAGVMFEGSNIAASVAELISDSAVSGSLGTFGQVTYQPFEETRVSFSCLWQVCRSPSYLFKSGTLFIPVGYLRRPKMPEVQREESSSSAGRKADDNSSGSIALMLDTELDETTNLSGWIELQKSSKILQWGASLSDIPEDELGWGLRMGGRTEGNFTQIQLEGFLNFNFGKNFSLQPALVYAMDGRNHTPAVLLHSSWYMRTFKIHDLQCLAYLNSRERKSWSLFKAMNVNVLLMRKIRGTGCHIESDPCNVQNQVNMDIGQCEVIQHSTRVTVTIASSITEKSIGRNKLYRCK